MYSTLPCLEDFPINSCCDVNVLSQPVESFLSIVALDPITQLCFHQTASTTSATVSHTSCLTQETVSKNDVQ